MVELIKLEIEGFGKFFKKEVINFEKGINFITGLNESGKSTVLEGLLASIFKYPSSKIDSLFSWKNPDVCRLILTYKTDKDETFKLISDYKNGKRRLEKITKKGTTEISSTIGTISEYIKKHFGFDEQKVFENTTFIRQSQMAILEDAITKNKIKDMIEEVFAGKAEASATKALKKIKKVVKESKEEAESLTTDLYELKKALAEAEESKGRIVGDSKKQEGVGKELSRKSEQLKRLKEDKELFEKKEKLLQETNNIDEKVRNIDEIIETLDEEKEEIIPVQKNKTPSIILIIAGALLCLTLVGAIIGIPLIIRGVNELKEQEEPKKRPKEAISEKISKYKKQKKDLINKKAVIETNLDKYELVKFTLNHFRDLEKLEKEVEDLKEKNVELRTSINKTKELVKSPEEILEEVNEIEENIKRLKEKAEEYNTAYTFLEKAETGVQHKFTPSIEKDSKSLLKEVTNDKYTELKVDEESLEISIKAPEIKDYINVDVLSQGARDQVYFTVRTVMSNLLSGSINLPLILDDPFHNFDDPRLKRTISILIRISKDKQIILISHRPYDKEFKGFAKNIIELK